jgi:hypothetical protein
MSEVFFVLRYELNRRGPAGREASLDQSVHGAEGGARGGTMGFPTLDQVEPRREFIEQNARDVKFLDV